MNETRSLSVAEIPLSRVSNGSVSSICKEISNEGEFRTEEKVYSRRIEINIRITIFEFVTFWII